MIDKFLVFILLTLFFLGGLGINLLEIKIFSFLIFLLITSILVIRRESLSIPKNFITYILFLLIICISLIWSKDKEKSFDLLILFFSGGLVWIIFYNLSDKVIKLFIRGIVFLGMIFGLFFIRSLITGKIYVNAFNLFSPLWFNSAHIHLGDYWTVCLIAVIYLFLKEKKTLLKIFLLIISILGLYFLISSSSRSAILGLIIGLYYFFSSGKLFLKYKKFSLIFASVLLLVFLFASSIKTTLFSRGYIVQGIVGLIRNPLGVGMGNFYLVSNDPKNQILGFDEVSNFAHNIIIETLSGVGIFGFIFIYWLVKIFQEMLNNKNNLYIAVFIAITVNFMFDFTYMIPTMFWLWFSFLGLSERQNSL